MPTRATRSSIQAFQSQKLRHPKGNRNVLYSNGVIACENSQLRYNRRMSDQTEQPTPDGGDEWYADGLTFECTQCGNCCTGPPGYVWFTDEEAKAMADYLSMSVKAFRDNFAHKVYGRWSLGEHKTQYGYDCVFLQRDETGKALCSVYPTRPKQCRTWPFWPENLRSMRDWLDVTRTCPGVKRGMDGEGTFYPIEQIRVIRDKHADDDDE